MKINDGAEGGGGQSLPSRSLVDAISISNEMAKHRNAVPVFCRLHNIASACNAGGSSSLHTRMNAAARVMRQLRCAAATHLKIIQRLLQHASNTQHCHDKRSAQHSTRAAAAAPALSSRDPASHAPLYTQPRAPPFYGSYAYRQARWPVDGTRSPRSRT